VEMKKKRPDVLKGKTEKLKTDCGSLYLTLNNTDEEGLIETRMELGKGGSCVNVLLKVIGILISIILQFMELDDIIKVFKRHVRGVSCGNPIFEKGKKFGSCIDMAAHRILVDLKEEKEEEKK
jgi:ribonucleoside-diphosphate reductase alpha chain